MEINRSAENLLHYRYSQLHILLLQLLDNALIQTIKTNKQTKKKSFSLPTLDNEAACAGWSSVYTASGSVVKQSKIFNLFSSTKSRDEPESESMRKMVPYTVTKDVKYVCFSPLHYYFRFTYKIV